MLFLKHANRRTNRKNNKHSQNNRKVNLSALIIRLALGFTVLFTWIDNIQKDLYDGDNLASFFNDYLFASVENGGNGSSLGFVKTILDATLLQAPNYSDGS